MEIILANSDLLTNAQKVFETLDIAENTRKDYQKSVKEFIRFVSGKGIDHNTFLNFKQHLKARNDIGVSSKNKYLISGRILLKEMSRTGMLPMDITHNVKGFTQGRKHKKDGLNDKDINILCEKMRGLPVTLEAFRFKAIATLLIFQGLRQKEIVGLDVEHVELKRNIAHIMGKGRDDREPIHLHPETSKALLAYMYSGNIKSGPLFFGLTGKRNRMVTRTLRRIVTKELKALGIDKSTHGFRHYFTTKLITTFKGDLLKVAQFTRHKSLDMLQVYNDAKITKESLPDFYQAFGGAKLH